MIDFCGSDFSRDAFAGVGVAPALSHETVACGSGFSRDVWEEQLSVGAAEAAML
jgi:hypothetical protein